MFGWLILLLLLWYTPVYPSSSDFNGSTSQVIVTSNAAIQEASFTVGCWMRREGDGAGSTGEPLGKDNGGATQEGWQIRNSGTDVMFIARVDPDQGRWTIARPATNTWAHVVVAYDGTSDANDPVMYLNGVSQSVTEVLTPAGTWNPGTINLGIGSIGSGGSAFWDGQLAECFFNSRVLASNEVKAVMNCGPKAVPNSVGYWPLGVFGGRNYTATSGLSGAETGLSTLGNGPPIRYVQGATCD
jgi:hypothetical protein